MRDEYIRDAQKVIQDPNVLINVVSRRVKQLRRGFTPRSAFDPSQLRGATSARILYSPAVARWEVEKGATPLADGSALSERAVGSPEWLIGEVLSFRGAAVVLDPPDLRARVADRARELERVFRHAGAKNRL